MKTGQILRVLVVVLVHNLVVLNLISSISLISLRNKFKALIQIRKWMIANLNQILL